MHDEIGVDASLGHQLGMTSLLHYGSIAEAADLVRVSHGRQAMGNHDRRSATGCLEVVLKCPIHVILDSCVSTDVTVSE